MSGGTFVSCREKETRFALRSVEERVKTANTISVASTDATSPRTLARASANSVKPINMMLAKPTTGAAQSKRQTTSDVTSRANASNKKGFNIRRKMVNEAVASWQPTRAERT